MYSFGILIAICVCAISFIWRTLNKKKKIVILISGKIGSGKTTTANILNELFSHITKTEKFSFATSLKKLASIVTGTPFDYYINAELKDDPLNKEFDLDLVGSTPRQTLKIIGQTVKSLFKDDEYWAKILKKIIQKGNVQVAIVDDWRFPYEQNPFIYDMTVFTIKINRQTEGGDETETALDNWNPDFIIDNDGCQDDLKKKVKKVFRDIIKIMPIAQLIR